MTIQEFLIPYNKSFKEIIEQYSDIFTKVYNNEQQKNWLVPIANKLDKFSDNKNQEDFRYVIDILKSENEFTQDDISKLSTFVSKVNSVVKVADRINNFKQDTILEDDSQLQLVTLFNTIKSTSTLKNFTLTLNRNLNNFRAHIFSVVKHCQSPDLYPVYYPFWQKVSKHILKIENDYDSICEFYRTFPEDNRTLNFGSYYGTLIKVIINNVNSIYDEVSQKAIVDFLKKEVINLSEYQNLLDDVLKPISNDNKKYWIYSPGEKAYKWDEFYSEQIMALGWDEIGDLVQYQTKNDIQTKLLSTYKSDTNRNNDAIANFEFANSASIGDIIIVKKGRYELLGFGEVMSDYYFDDDRDDYKHCRRMQWKLSGNWNVDHTLVMKTLTDITTYASGLNDGKKYYEHLLSIMENTTIKVQDNPIVNLLKYKKQIILQGPPGTGKTKLAKDLGKKIITDNLRKVSNNKISINDLTSLFKINDILLSSNNKTSYKVIDKDNNSMKLSSETRKEIDTVTFETLLKCIENPTDFPLGTGLNSQNRAAANYAIDKLKDIFHLNNINGDSEDNQLKLIQFHPSYTYEDFVRGIVAESKGEKIEYKNVNKTLGLFAKEALANFKASTSGSPKANLEAWIDEKFDLFKNEIDARLPEDQIKLSGDITIFEVTDSHFKYAEKWKTPGYLKFIEFKKLIKAVLLNELELSSKQLDKEKFIHAHYRYTYYNALLKLFFDQYTYEKETVKIEAKNYVLIIDEINRANLSSVLGELIYALEYRGEKVESMYEVDGSQKLILPPNLYIIGTMNTADRSVGHIDYAIRRRFAFVDVLPEKLQDNTDIFFNTTDFVEVAKLFIKVGENDAINFENAKNSDFLSNDFYAKDVALGHSYFIAEKKKVSLEEKDNYFKMKMKYEIIPILNEYLKDGVFNESATAKIKEIEQRFV
ncbi:AAA family ATPase [Chryseobacterium aahli]|uniref:AAA family ATPase n=1 Tax=Chryseobacterium aahli TaxID=1278643 RepID=UPI001F61C4AB|nr:AAA family ATPase [Chryseobacterium aahli]MCI3938260.1 AAA family ATPase [Chryseobacterium aahli]